MSIQLPIEVWQLADRYVEVLQAINKVNMITDHIERAIEHSRLLTSALELNRSLQSTVDHHLTSDVTIETSTDRLLTFYRDPLDSCHIYVLTTERSHRPLIDRPSTEPIDASEYASFRRANPIDQYPAELSECGPDY